MKMVDIFQRNFRRAVGKFALGVTGEHVFQVAGKRDVAGSAGDDGMTLVGDPDGHIAVLFQFILQE